MVYQNIYMYIPICKNSILTDKVQISASIAISIMGY